MQWHDSTAGRSLEGPGRRAVGSVVVRLHRVIHRGRLASGPVATFAALARSTSGHSPLVGTHIASPAPNAWALDSVDGDVVVLCAMARDLPEVDRLAAWRLV